MATVPVWEAAALVGAPPFLRFSSLTARGRRLCVAQSFSWPDQGYATVQRFCPELADLLDREFETIKNLTYGSLGDLRGVDTFKVRWCKAEAGGGA